MKHSTITIQCLNLKTGLVEKSFDSFIEARDYKSKSIHSIKLVHPLDITKKRNTTKKD